MLSGGSDDELAGAIEGAFERRGRRFGVGGFTEPCRARWLTVDGFFADLRYCERPSGDPQLLDATQAFSGQVSSHAGTVTWFHDLDTEPRSADHSDTARIYGRGDHLLEVGEGYEERWVRADRGQARRAVAQWVDASKAGPAAAGPVTAGPVTTGSPGVGGRTADAMATVARIVVVDHLAVAIWRTPRPGGAAFEHGTDWRPTDLVGASFDGNLISVVTALARGEPLPSPWTVVVAPG